MDDTTDDDAASVLPTMQVSAADRLRRFTEDDAALAELATKVHERAMGEGENANAAGHLDLKLRERRAQMWGYDSPIRFDLVQVSQNQQGSGHDKMMSTLRAFLDRLPPAQKALRQRLAEMSPEEALERLGLPSPDSPPLTVPEGDEPGGSVDGNRAA